MKAMREILFRGQTRRRNEKIKMNGEPLESNWVYGGIFPTGGDHAIIYQPEPEVKKYPVYSDTVGQYIGLKDKKGKKIFEGDILRRNGRDIFVVKWSNLLARFEMKLIESGASYNPTIIRGECEVIGNIYDNPELMEVEEEDAT